MQGKTPQRALMTSYFALVKKRVVKKKLTDYGFKIIPRKKRYVQTTLANWLRPRP